jgi:hypothetical protein
VDLHVDLHSFRSMVGETKSRLSMSNYSTIHTLSTTSTIMSHSTRSQRSGRIRLGAMAVFASCFALQVGAQDLASLTERPVAAAKPTPPAVPESPANEARRLRVETALRDDPYFNDTHVTVSLKNGVVVLQGFVSSEWDLLHAIRIAKSAAGDGRVVDDLYLDLGGRR